MASDASGPGDTKQFRLRMPLGADWFTLSTGTDEPDLELLARQVDERIVREPRLLDNRQKLIDMLASFSRLATERRASPAALRWALNELDGVSVATLFITSYEDERVSDNDGVLAFLQERMAPRYGSDKTDPKVELRELPVGRAVRIQVISDTGFAGSPDAMAEPEPAGLGDVRQGSLLQETVQYWLPVPGHTVLLLLSFSTPNLAAAAGGLVAELDQIVEGLQLTTT